MIDLEHKVQQFISQDFPSLTKKYFEELATELPYQYKPLGTVNYDGKNYNTFDFIELTVRSEFGIHFELSKYFDFHTKSIFQSQPIDFGFTAVNQYPTAFENQKLLDAPFNRVNFHLFEGHSFGGLSGLSSKIIKEKVKQDHELYFEYIRLQLKSHLKRFFLYGRVEWRWIVLDQLVHHGIDHFPRCLNGEFNYLEYSMDFFFRIGGLGTHISGVPYKETEHYKMQLEFYHELKTKVAEGFTYVDVLKRYQMEQKIGMSQSLSDNSEIYAKCEALGNVHLVAASSISSWNESPRFKIDLADVIDDDARIHDILATYNEPENALRQMFNLPNIGEGWISETNLYYEIKEYFTSDIVVQHGKPKWLGKQHLDIWLPKHNIGIEYQGDQHYYPVDFFGGEASLAHNMARDKRKKELCEKFGCRLIYVLPDYNLSVVLSEIEEFIHKSI